MATLFCFGSSSHRPGIETKILDHLTFPASTSANINTIYIPFTLIGHLMIVEGKVNDLTGRFIIDTGSERLLLNKKYLPADLPGRLVTSVGNTGMLEAKEHQVDTLHLDQLTIPNLTAHLVDLNHIETKKNTKILGILGYNVFKDFELFIDFPNSRIVLSRIDKSGCRLDLALPWEIPYDSLTFDLKKHLIVIHTVVNNINLDMILDSGAELNLIDRKVNKKV
ncbi:MAG TPA: retropepsin-like aspartic protease, partial [Saprospiraceae bacterium]|nr:retropepsin-like aspartic protease [Saprospiraceae bacterium]